MPLRRLSTPKKGIVDWDQRTTEVVLPNGGVRQGLCIASWMPEPSTNYKLQTSSITFRSNVSGGGVKVWWYITTTNLSTSTPGDYSNDQGFRTVGYDTTFCYSANLNRYTIPAFDTVIGSGATPPTWYSFGWMAGTNDSNVVPYDTANATVNAGADIPLQMWVEKL